MKNLILATLRQYGWQIISRGFKSTLRRVGVIIESFYLMEYIIDDKKLFSKIKHYDYFDVKELTIKDFEGTNFFSIDKLKLFQNRFESDNYSCYGIKVQDELVYSTWISWKKMGYPTYFNRSEDLDANKALLEDSFCHPNYRGKGYHSKMNLFRIHKISQSGRKIVLALVLKENSPALKVQSKSGFKIRKKISFLKIWKTTRIKEKEYNERD